MFVFLFVFKLFILRLFNKKSFSEIGKAPYGILAGVKNGKCFVEGEWGSSICESMKPVEGDIIVKGKRGLCAFHSTNLDFILRQNNIKNVVLGGFLTNCCVESTMRTAYENGYRVYTLKDCCAATSMAGQEAAYEHTFGMFSHPTTSDAIIKAVST
jgi:nicotinamidase-related amidase